MMNESELRQAIDRFASAISDGPIGLAFPEPAPGATWRNCLSNAANVARAMGGQPRYGWTFQHKIARDIGEYLVATHHSVWHRKDGALVDVTPVPDDPSVRPLTPGGLVLFLVDDSAQPVQVSNAIVPLPLRFFPAAGSPKIEQYVSDLEKKEACDYEALCRSLRST